MNVWTIRVSTGVNVQILLVNSVIRDVNPTVLVCGAIIVLANVYLIIRLFEYSDAIGRVVDKPSPHGIAAAIHVQQRYWQLTGFVMVITGVVGGVIGGLSAL